MPTAATQGYDRHPAAGGGGGGANKRGGAGIKQHIQQVRKIYIANFGPLYRALKRFFGETNLQYNFPKIRGRGVKGGLEIHPI